MKRVFFLSAFLLAIVSPTGGQDGQQEPQSPFLRRRDVPDVKTDRVKDIDAAFEQMPSGKPAIDLILELADSIYPVTAKIPGSLAWFEVRLDRELVLNGTDAPRWDILQNALQAGRVAGQGYAALVQNAMFPMARAVPDVDKIFPKLEEQVKMNAQIAQQLLAAVKGAQQQGQPPDPEQLQALEQQSEKVRNVINELRQPLMQAYSTVLGGRTGLSAAESARMRLMSTGVGTIDEAKKLDYNALDKSTKNLASGRIDPESASKEGRSGPVLEMVARRLEAATKRAGIAFMWESKMTEPQMGFIAIVFKLVTDVDDLVKQTSQEGRRNDPNAGRHAQEAQDLSTATTLTFMKVRDGWGQIKEKALGKETEDGEDGVAARCPVPLPEPPIRAQAPKPKQDLFDAVGSRRQAQQRDQKGQPIRFPDELKKDTQTIMRRQGIADGNFSCPGC